MHASAYVHVSHALAEGCIVCGAGAENKGPIIGLGGIPLFVMLLSEGTPRAKCHAAGALWNLTLSTDSKVAIVHANGIPALVNLLLESELGEATECAAEAHTMHMYTCACVCMCICMSELGTATECAAEAHTMHMYTCACVCMCTCMSELGEATECAAEAHTMHVHSPMRTHELNNALAEG